MPNLPAIVFCTTCKGRVQHIEKTLPKNLADNADYENCKFVLLDYNSPDHLIPYLKANHQASIDSGKLVVYSYREPGPFKMAHAKNMAHRLGILEGSEILCNLDADNFTGPGFASYIAEQFRTEENIFLWARMIFTGENQTPRGINGRLVVSARAFLHTGGYDEQFATWSPDDKDFNLRLRRLGYERREIDRQYLQAVLHNDKMRFREYKHVSTAATEDDAHSESVDSSDTTVANFGRIGCGTVFKNFSHELWTVTAPGVYGIDLGPLHTRIFGIGMHKTATTSLHMAFKILGFDSAHWKSAHWAKSIWDEMHSSGRSLTLEKHYALCDLPITLLYEKLDVAYPGSKFILTTRNEERWLQSVRNHWSPEHNKFRAAWDTDPFTHRIHKALYGQKNFDAEIFIARYRRHNAEVQEYFKDRPGDLLVMDMDRNPGWSELCAFLDRPIPGVAYPRALVTDMNMHAGDRVQYSKQWLDGARGERATEYFITGETPHSALNRLGTIVGVTLEGGVKVKWDGCRGAEVLHPDSIAVVKE